MTKYCESCGSNINDGAKFCSTCGLALNKSIEDKMNIKSEGNQSPIPEKIRENLKKYSKHLNLTCLECGYVGLMGISRIDESKKNKWGIWVLGGLGFIFGLVFGFSLIATILIGAIGGILLILSDREKIKTHVVCPSCLKELKVN